MYKNVQKRLLSVDESYYDNYKRHLHAVKLEENKASSASLSVLVKESKNGAENKGYIEDSITVEYNKNSQEIRI